MSAYAVTLRLPVQAGVGLSAPALRARERLAVNWRHSRQLSVHPRAVQQARTSQQQQVSSIDGSRSILSSKSGNGGWRSSSGRSHGKQRQSRASSATPQGRPSSIWLLLPLSMSKIRLDEDKQADSGLKDKAQDLYARAVDKTVAEAEPLLEHDDHQPTLLGRIVDFFNTWLIEPLGTARRFCYLAFLFLPVIVTAPILLLETVREPAATPGQARSSSRKKRRTGQKRSTRWWYSFLVKQMERAGPTFIKLAQWAGSRRDLFPDELCDMFGRLHSNGKAHSLRYTKRVLEKAFKKPFDQIFLEFNETPMGIGAVAQAYKGVLNPDLVPLEYMGPKYDQPASVLPLPLPGPPPRDERENAPSTEVAIKVLHPRVEKTINRDLKIMGLFARMLDAFPGMEWLSFPQEVEVFGDMMKSQLDLTHEAQNLLRFEENFKHRTVVSFPRPLMDYTSRRVLVEEYEDAVPLKHFLNEGGGPFDYRIASLGLDAFLEMLLLDNFVHADLHPGNIMVKFYKPTTSTMLRSIWARLFDTTEPDQASSQATANHEVSAKLRSLHHKQDEWIAELERLHEAGYEPEIVLLDTGLVTELHDENRRNFIDLFKAVAEFDGHKAGRLMVERCKSPELVIDDETFALKIQHLVLSVKSRTFSLAQIKISDILSEVLQAVRTHHVRLEGDFINTVLSILLLEGIGRQLDPNMDLFKGALPILRQMGKQVGSTSSLKEGFSSGSIWPMLKVWLYMEAREFASVAVSEVEDLVKYDRLTMNI